MTPEAPNQADLPKANWEKMSGADREAFLTSIQGSVAGSESDPDGHHWDNKTPAELAAMNFDDLPGVLKGQLAMSAEADGSFKAPDIEVTAVSHED